MINLTISRRRWLTIGKDASEHKKLHFDSGLQPGDKMCCLGFFAKQAVGLKKKNIQYYGMPADIYSTTTPTEIPKVWKGLLNKNGHNTRVCIQLASVNDDCDHYTIPQKQTKIKALFKRIGVRVTFKP